MCCNGNFITKKMNFTTQDLEKRNLTDFLEIVELKDLINNLISMQQLQMQVVAISNSTNDEDFEEIRTSHLFETQMLMLEEIKKLSLKLRLYENSIYDVAIIYQLNRGYSFEEAQESVKERVEDAFLLYDEEEQGYYFFEERQEQPILNSYYEEDLPEEIYVIYDSYGAESYAEELGEVEENWDPWDELYNQR